MPKLHTLTIAIVAILFVASIAALVAGNMPLAILLAFGSLGATIAADWLGSTPKS